MPHTRGHCLSFSETSFLPHHPPLILQDVSWAVSAFPGLLRIIQTHLYYGTQTNVYDLKYLFTQQDHDPLRSNRNRVFLIFVCTATCVRPGAEVELNKWMVNKMLYIAFHLPCSIYFLIRNMELSLTELEHMSRKKKENVFTISFWVWLLTCPCPASRRFF